jgi:hypothetical protein
MRYTIFQMPVSLWHKNHIIFNENTLVSLADYCAVWEDELIGKYIRPEDALEEIFFIFNTQYPKHYAGRPLSGGDIVKLEDTYYLCCSTGWRKLKDEEK